MTAADACCATSSDDANRERAVGLIVYDSEQRGGMWKWSLVDGWKRKGQRVAVQVLTVVSIRSSATRPHQPVRHTPLTFKKLVVNVDDGRRSHVQPCQVGRAILACQVLEWSSQGPDPPDAKLVSASHLDPELPQTSLPQNVTIYIWVLDQDDMGTLERVDGRKGDSSSHAHS